MRREPKSAKLDFQHEDEFQQSTDLESHLVDHSPSPKKSSYSKFDQINGLHPWQTSVPEGYISYQARIVKKAKIAYFNFDLAREMGLLPKNHSNEISSELKTKLIDTFSLQIINEYDIEHDVKFKPSELKPNPYMATRYLQLQHPNKQGKTSGDGRSIWNGVFEAKGKTWDVSSRGTGVTALSPGTIEAGENLQTGQESFGFGCGLAELDELYATAIMSEIFHQQGIASERTLLVLETGPGVGIGVRAAENLVRPAHLFSFLKQNNRDALKRATDYFLERQFKNSKLDFKPGKPSSYKKLLKHLCSQYAKFAARLEADYVFAWFDWDGDNMLMDAGILDYGSIRQFGIRHDEYRYDDVTRYSTNLNEQKIKTKKIIQVFCQLVDFLITGEKKKLSFFDDAKTLRDFDREFKDESKSLFLKKLGLSKSQIDLAKTRTEFQICYEAYLNIEMAKASQKATEVDDGINKQPLFNARSLLFILPEQFLAKDMKVEDIYQQALASECRDTHAEASRHQLQNLRKFTDAYSQCISLLGLNNSGIKNIAKRAYTNNHPERITGNSISYIVHEIIALRKNRLSGSHLQKFIDMFVYNQLKKINPNIKAPKYNRVPREVLKQAMHIVQEHSEDI